MRICFYICLILLQTVVFQSNVFADDIQIANPDRGSLGFVPERIVHEAYLNLGMSPVIRETTQANSLELVNSGQVDAELCRAEGMEKFYPNLIRVPVSVYSFSYVGLVFEPDLQVEDSDDLASCIVGYLAGAVKMREKFGARCKALVPYHDIGEAFSLLHSKQIDIMLVERHLAKRLLKHEAHPSMRLVEIPFLSADLYHYVHKRHAALVPLLARELSEIQAQQK